LRLKLCTSVAYFYFHEAGKTRSNPQTLQLDLRGGEKETDEKREGTKKKKWKKGKYEVGEC